MYEYKVLTERDKRFAGSTKYPLGKMMKSALDGITGFYSQPLRLASHAVLFFAIDSLALLSGQLPPRAMGLVAEWATRFLPNTNRRV